MRVRDLKNLRRAAEFYDQACKAGTWQGCMGYATHLIGLGFAENASSADKARWSAESVRLLDGVIKAQPKAWRAYFYKSEALLLTATTPAHSAVIAALRKQARTVAAQMTDRDDWDAVLWPPPQ